VLPTGTAPYDDAEMGAHARADSHWARLLALGNEAEESRRCMKLPRTAASLHRIWL
jgi:hypothetical protein